MTEEPIKCECGDDRIPKEIFKRLTAASQPVTAICTRLELELVQFPVLMSGGDGE